MKILLSLNYRHFKITPNEIISLLKKYDNNNIIKGFEVSIKYDNDLVYLKQLAGICKNKGYLLRLHAPTLININKYEEYFDFVNKITQIYEDSLNVVFHPINAESIEKSISKTVQYLKHIYEYIEIKRYKRIIISIENLNDINGLERIKKENIEGILKKFEKLKFTYDIGHELIDNNSVSNLSDLLLDRLNNIHIHAYDGNKDHYPILRENEKSIKVLMVLEEIKNKGYNDVIVSEYALDYIEGNDFNTKMINYIRYSIMLGDNKRIN